MILFRFKQINALTGAALFLFSATVYVLTLEPTASFWDCAEFIACANKLEIPHPPGAPLFLLIGRLFSLLAGNDVGKIAYWINVSSALASAGTIAFLYWTIVLIVRKIIRVSEEKPSYDHIIIVVGSGILGALAFTFSDTFWFSAVEGEVYALSSLFTSIVLWAIFKWEFIADKPGSEKYLLLIAYTIGLSIGVHLLCLLAIPAISLLYFYKKYSYTHKGLFYAFIIGFGVLEFIQMGIIEGLPTLALKTEILFVNTLHLPFGSGVTAFCILFFMMVLCAMMYSVKKKKFILNLIVLCLVFFITGFSSYTIILIRSAYNPPIDQNDPENVLNFLYYIKREQYVQRPIFYGPNYTAELIEQKNEDPVYVKGKNRYEITGYNMKNIFDPKHCTIFPRMTSKEPSHAQLYRQWLNIPEGRKPSLINNIQFFIKYQVGHMYWRYLLWNFAGREGDTQDSSWLRPWDALKNIPSSIYNNKYRNNYFMLPFILGLIGFVFLFKKSRSSLVVTVTLFLFTGLILVIYQNSPPTEPRERDYIYVGSFYIFCIWIGLGLPALSEIIRKITDRRGALMATLISCLAVPVLMAKEGWNDHDRSMRVHSSEFARNILSSCEKDSILFTVGDSDTFMIWYVQEVEGFRTDVRVCNLSLFNIEYYIDGMKRQSNLSSPLPISFNKSQYSKGKNEYIPYVENAEGKNGILLPIYLELIKKCDPGITVQSYNGDSLPILPSSILILPIDTADIKNKYESVKHLDTSLKWDIGKKALDKSQLLVLDMIVNNKWKRPIYFSMALSDEYYLGLKNYMRMEGYTYRLFPFKTNINNEVPVNVDMSYEYIKNKMHLTNLDDPNGNYDENYKRMIQLSRMVLLRSAIALYEEGKPDKALEVINISLNKIPDRCISYDYTAVQLLSLLFELKQYKRAIDISKMLGSRICEEISYYYNNDLSENENCRMGLYTLYNLINILKERGYNEQADAYKNVLSKYAPLR